MQNKGKGDIWNDSYNSPSTIMSVLVALTDGEDWVLPCSVHSISENFLTYAHTISHFSTISLIEVGSLTLAMVSQTVFCKTFSTVKRFILPKQSPLNLLSHHPPRPPPQKKPCKESLLDKDRVPRTHNHGFWNLSSSLIIYSSIYLLHVLQHIRIWFSPYSPWMFLYLFFCTSLLWIECITNPSSYD